jgi:Brp/Blh family beta-carotene 15,15'-monooxygenase
MQTSPITIIKTGYPVLVTLVFIGIQTLLPGISQPLIAGFILLGMIFPGIPHGALDHCLQHHDALRGKALARFVGQYLFYMAIVGLLWIVSPEAGVITFILYSAWHFGETDVRKWEAFHPALALLYGLALLTFLLTSHPETFVAYLQALGLKTMDWATSHTLLMLSIASLCLLIPTAFFIPKKSLLSWAVTLAVLLLSVQLPLLLAFGLYFIVLHSAQGWSDLHKGLGLPHSHLFKKALPFSLGAYALFVGLFFAKSLLGFQIEGLIPTLFIFLAAVSAPHIWMMHAFYQRASA